MKEIREEEDDDDCTEERDRERRVELIKTFHKRIFGLA